MLKRVGELRDGSGADQASGDAFADQTLAARGLGRDDRQVASHCLQRHIAECFSNRRVEQDIHRRNGPAQIRAHLKSRKDAGGEARSEEHTSELQSLMSISYAGFRLKKKNETINIT